MIEPIVATAVIVAVVAVILLAAHVDVHDVVPWYYKGCDCDGGGRP